MTKHTNRILIGVSGGIAAYKICELVSNLAKRTDFEVRVILTESAKEFVSPLTFATLSRHSAYLDADFWQPRHGRPLHIELGEWAELILLAPLTANTLAKVVWGMADNLLTNTLLASHCPVLVAPAMNTTMWEQESVQRNWQELRKNARYKAIAPGSGRLACDVVGMGRMAEPAEILVNIESLIHTKGKQDLSGKKVLVSAGGTREFLDAVRFIGNPSTGKQGIAIAQAAYHRGAEVTLILAGNLEITLPFPVIQVESARQMQVAMQTEFPRSDLIVMAAAVGDFRPKLSSDRKLAKSELSLNLELELIPDILKDLSDRKSASQILVGFAAQTGPDSEILTIGREKLFTKKLDAIAINSVNPNQSQNQAQTGFGSETNQAIFCHQDGRELRSPLCSKLELAHRLFDFLL